MNMKPNPALRAALGKALRLVGCAMGIAGPWAVHADPPAPAQFQAQFLRLCDLATSRPLAAAPVVPGPLDAPGAEGGQSTLL